jgi:SnoaL-like domain
MKKIQLFIVLLFGITVYAQDTPDTKSTEQIHFLLDNWHRAAAKANFNDYFNAMADESIFIGTDATENWNKKAFQDYSKPYFDKGKAWSFTPLERHIYFSKDGKTAWFDELLNTQMKICRGSGVVEKVKGEWKIKHYVLSMTIPNDNSDEVIKIKSLLENPIIESLKK